MRRFHARSYFIVFLLLATLLCFFPRPIEAPYSEIYQASEAAPVSIRTESAPPTQSQVRELSAPVAELPAAPGAKLDARQAAAAIRTTAIPTANIGAVPKKRYHPSMGREVARRSGYVIFENGLAHGSLTDFDGNTLPVVSAPNRPVLGIADGTITVIFKQYPADIKKFAMEHGFTVAYEASHLKTAFLAPSRLPANLVRLQEQVSHLPEVKTAHLSVIFGSRGTK